VKQLHIGVFDNAQSNDTGPRSGATQTISGSTFDSLSYWAEIAGICEEAKASTSSSWRTPGAGLTWRASDPTCARSKGLELPRLDPAVVVVDPGATDTHLGLVITGATLVEQPYPLARRLASIDQSPAVARLEHRHRRFCGHGGAVLGVATVKHDDRYDMADDFMEVVYKVWEGCWSPMR